MFFLLRVCAYGVAKIIKYNIHEEVEVVNFSLMDWQSSIFIFFLLKEPLIKLDITYAESWFLLQAFLVYVERREAI